MLANRFHVLFVLAVAITGASAQNFSSCGQACLAQVTTNGVCHSLTNVTCLCTNTAVQTTLGACFQNCSSSDQAEAKQLETSTCANSTTTKSSNTTSTTTQHSASSTPASAASSASSASASKASSSASPVEQLPFISVVIAIAGAAIGGAFAL